MPTPPRREGAEVAGCGKPTHVAGTNGGLMPCGALLTCFGTTEPYYCGVCIARFAFLPTPTEGA
jgi:hypothetical protein